MNSTKKRYMPRLAAVCAAVMLVVALACAAYATDLGGIRSSIQALFRGEEIGATLEVNGTTFTVSGTRPDGVAYKYYGLGEVLQTPSGEFVRDMTEEEILKYAPMALNDHGKWGSEPWETATFHEGSMLDMVDPDADFADPEGMAAGFGFHEGDQLFCIHIFDHEPQE